MGIERRTPKAASGCHARMPSQTARAIGDLTREALVVHIEVHGQGVPWRLGSACAHQM